MEGPFAEIISGIILIVVMAVGGYVVNFFRIKKSEILNNSGDIQCIKRAIIMMSKKIDRGTQKSHPGQDSNIEDLVRDLLKEDILDKE
jgi:small neutral amino acid transporter SnatA (MarC family)